MAGANGICPPMIQINSPIYGTMTFVIHVKGVFTRNLNNRHVSNWVNGIKKHNK